MATRLQYGSYRLDTQLENPMGDKRRRYGWERRPFFGAGYYFVDEEGSICHAREGGKLYPFSTYPRSEEAYEALARALVSDDSLEALVAHIARDRHVSARDMFLQLVREGRLSRDDIRKLADAVAERLDNEEV